MDFNNIPTHTLTTGFSGQRLTADAVSGGMAFLEAELEKRDPKVREPLTSVTYARDIPIKTGGGWVEYSTTFDVSYGISDPNTNGLIGGQTNAIPVVQADVSKNIFKVFTWANMLKVPLVDQNKLQGIGRSLDDILDKGIRLNYNKTLDELVYTGVSVAGITGLVNDINVTASAPAAGSGGGTQWSGKTPDEILTDINQAMVATWTASEFDLTGMANHILIPPVQYAKLVSTKVSEAGNVSILEFLLNNNIGKNQGIELQIHPSRWCTGAGVGNADRMVAYVNDEDRINLDLTVPLGRVMTAPDINTLSYMTAYAARFSQIKFLYYQPVIYIDGI